MKKCNKCLEIKHINSFHKNKVISDGYAFYCKQCYSEIHKNRNYKQIDKKACRHCKEDFSPKQERSEFCSKDCRERYKYWSDVETNREDARLYAKDYAKTTKYREYKKAYYEKMKNNLEYILPYYLRNRLYMALRNRQKTGSAIEMLGCSIKELRIYLESKFQTGMTWNNYSFRGWHIDHIKPLSKFDLTDRDQLNKACHYTNLQPLWAVDNLRKGNREISHET